MPIMNCIYDIPLLYIVVMISFSLYYAIRDLFEQSVYLKSAEKDQSSNKLTKCEKIIILYMQGFLFKFVTVISSFIALWVGYKILLSLKSFDNIGVGTAILLVFLFAWGIIGAGGYLTAYISQGKLPGFKI